MAYEEAMVLQDEPGIVQPVGVSRTDVFFDEAYLKKSRDKLLSLVPEAEDKRVVVYAPTFRGRVAHAEAPTALDIEAMKRTMGEDAGASHQTSPLCARAARHTGELS